MKIRHPEIGICGLACRLCPRFNTTAASRCRGCKSAGRMAAGCLFITCAIKKQGVEFCGDCDESNSCEKWQKHREAGKKHDSFKCYQKLEDDIKFIQQNGIAKFEKIQQMREQLLQEMLHGFNDGRSKSYYCIVATVMKIAELKNALSQAKQNSKGLSIKEKSKLLHSILDKIAKQKKYCLKLRK